MLVRDVMTPVVACCHLHASLRDAAQLMREHGCGCLPVSRNASDPHDLVGLVTDRDVVCRAVADALDPLVTTVSSVMSSPVATIAADVHVAHCIDLMAEKKIRRLVVVDRQGRCCGIVSTGDIARAVPGGDAGALLQEICEPAMPAPKPALKSFTAQGNRGW
jgi:CBS domain-containing protein